jgi:G:T/U-mismatch repair DNA glycosylase
MKHIERHPFPELIPKGVKTLIIGSFPPIKLTADQKNISGDNKHLYESYFQRFRDQRPGSNISFYYGSKENLFWELMKEAFGVQEELDTPEAIKSFLGKKLIGITDIIEKCQRRASRRNPTKTNPQSDCIGSLDKDLIILESRDVVGSIIKNNIERVFCTSKYVHKKLMDLDKKEGQRLKQLQIEPTILLSPSPAASISISRRAEYKRKKEKDPSYSTKKYRIEEYRKVFGL